MNSGKLILFLGNLGRNTVISPGVANIDFSLMKDTTMGWLGESGALQFRAEFFNLLISCQLRRSFSQELVQLERQSTQRRRPNHLHANLGTADSIRPQAGFLRRAVYANVVGLTGSR